MVNPSSIRSSFAPRCPIGRPGRPAERTEPLTSIEQEMLRLVAQGLTNREIGERLRWSVGTVKKYLQRALEKLGASDRTQAAVEAVKRGLLP